MSSFMQSVFGTYTPYIDQNTGDVFADWSYIGGVLLFGVFLYCIFRLIGGWTSKK